MTVTFQVVKYALKIGGCPGMNGGSYWYTVRIRVGVKVKVRVRGYILNCHSFPDTLSGDLSVITSKSHSWLFWRK